MFELPAGIAVAGDLVLKNNSSAKQLVRSCRIMIPSVAELLSQYIGDLSQMLHDVWNIHQIILALKIIQM